MQDLLKKVDFYKNITEQDRELARKYIYFYDLQPNEIADNADAFFEECYELVRDKEYGVDSIKVRDEMPWDSCKTMPKTITTEHLLERFENTALRKENRTVRSAFLVFLGVCVISLLVLTHFYQKSYNLGKAVLDSGICVEYDMGYSCETPDNHIFIEK